MTGSNRITIVSNGAWLNGFPASMTGTNYVAAGRPSNALFARESSLPAFDETADPFARVAACENAW